MPSISLGGSSDTPGTEIQIDGYRAVVRNGHIIVHIPSKRDPTRFYRIYHTNVVTTCTCPGFDYAEHCWHVTWAREKFKFPVS